jgi:hypothetical protein
LEVKGTGGGCEAYVAKLSNGWEVVVTDHGDPSLPDLKSTAVDVGVYRDEEWQERVTFQTMRLERPKRIKDQTHLKAICEAIAYRVVSRHLDGEFTVPCGLCGVQTPMTGTERCDRCWELETRIKADPELARKILEAL